MKLLFIGDSITDMRRDRNADHTVYSYGSGYVFPIEGYLGSEFPQKYEILNRGISGNRIVDVYQRIKIDCWNLNPDVITILVGANDVYHEVKYGNGVELDRYERFYNMLIEDTKRVLPNARIIIMGSFVTLGAETASAFEKMSEIKDYASVAQRVALSHGCRYISLQDRFDMLTKDVPVDYYISDGIHPTAVGAHVIAREWLTEFGKMEGFAVNND